MAPADDVTAVDPALDTDDGDTDDGDTDDLDDDDVVVLSWWQHPVNVLTVVVATALIAGLIGWMVGDANADDDPSEVDIGFLQDMREHHDQAVAMGFIYLDLPDTDPRLGAVARSIVFGQSIEIGRMIQLLRDFDADEANMGDTSMGWMGMSAEVGQMPGMASPDQLDALQSSSGAAADQLFVELMTAHHEGGIDMAEYAAENASVGEVRAMATAIAGSQAEEIAELTGLVG